MGRWEQGQVRCAWGESTFSLDAEVAARIEEEWARWGRRPGIHLFDGPMCRLESFAVADDRLELTLSRIGYKQFVGTNMSPPELGDRLGECSLANPVGLSCAVASAEGSLVLGRRNAKVAYYPNRIHPFAGALEPSERVDVFEEAKRELAEEISLGEGEIVSMELRAVAEDRTLRQPELIFLVRSRRGKVEMERNLDQTEHRELVWITPQREAIEARLHQEELTPIGRAAVALWGLELLGPEWFARNGG